jgi:hypothetical protein
LSGAKYTVLYASQPSGLLESPSGLPLGRHLAEKKTNGTKAVQGEKEKCDGECLVKSSLLEGTFVVSCCCACAPFHSFHYLISSYSEKKNVGLHCILVLYSHTHPGST